ncbi:MAG: V-type ATPase subunit [Planctomycetes bacterium]|nr:V-type ATPase subunit [Planctomycetota bacterium]
MWPTDEYEFINAKVHGMRSRLRETDRLTALLNCSGLTDLLQTLCPGRRQAFMDDVAIERSLMEQLFEDLAQIRQHMNGPSRALIETILLRRTVENGKVVIQFWRQQKQGEPPPGEIEDYLVRDPNAPPPAVKDLLAAGSLPELFARLRLQEALPDLPEQMAPVFERYERDGVLFYVFAALDRAYYDLLWQRVQDLRRGDRRVAVRIVGLEMDIASIFTALRLRFTYGLPTEDTVPLLSAHGRLLQMDTLDRMCRAEDAEGLVQQLPAEYRTLFERADGNLGDCERLFWDHLCRVANRTFYGNQFDIGVVVGYAALRKIEFMNLARVIQGFRYELPANDIRRELIPLAT